MITFTATVHCDGDGDYYIPDADRCTATCEVKLRLYTTTQTITDDSGNRLDSFDVTTTDVFESPNDWIVNSRMERCPACIESFARKLEEARKAIPERIAKVK